MAWAGFLKGVDGTGVLRGCREGLKMTCEKTRKMLALLLALCIVFGFMISGVSATPRSPHNGGYDPIDNPDNKINNVNDYSDADTLDKKIDRAADSVKHEAKKTVKKIKKAVKRSKK